MIELRPVIRDDGTIALWDIFIDGQWHGSRQTYEQAEAMAAWLQSAIAPNGGEDGQESPPAAG